MRRNIQIRDLLTLCPVFLSNGIIQLCPAYLACTTEHAGRVLAHSRGFPTAPHAVSATTSETAGREPLGLIRDYDWREVLGACRLLGSTMPLLDVARSPMLSTQATRRLLPWLVTSAFPLLAQPLQVFDHAPDSFVGAGTCEACHAAQFASQSASGHALSLARVADHRLAPLFVPPGPLTRPNGASYSYRAEGDGLRVEIATGAGRLGLQLEWAFGAGEQAVTFVGRFDEERYVEHHFSYFAADDSLATTPGHRNDPVRGPEDALGVYYPTFASNPAIMRCFQCHSTGPLALGEGLSLRPHEVGVRCEACHGPGRGHVEAVAAGDLAGARGSVGNPGRLRGGELLDFCGACHRPPASSGTVIDWSDPWNVRHQPVYLSRSACVQSDGEALSCMGCHDPHQPLSREVARDDRNCLDCHSTRRPPATVCRAASDQSCSSCHMPPVRPQSNLRFANHWIGIYDRDRPLRPR